MHTHIVKSKRTSDHSVQTFKIKHLRLYACKSKRTNGTFGRLSVQIFRQKHSTLQISCRLEPLRYKQSIG